MAFLPYLESATALASHPGRFAKALSEKDLASAVEALQAAVEAVGYQATLKPPSVAKGQEHEVLLVGRCSEQPAQGMASGWAS